ncbi:MAG: transporter [Chitinophagaceae bacterium]|jgi:predicted MFS family arabinose efflux permease|nr:transporter [Chitinophagaceae bacterium]
MLSATAKIYRSAYMGLSRETWLLSLVMLINRAGTMVLGFMTLYCVDGLGLKVSQAGIVMASFGAGSILGGFLGGKITDRFGFYYLQVGALVTGGIMFIVVGYLREFIPLCIGTFVLSLCNESFRPANSTAIAHYSTIGNRTRSYSLNRLAINLGWAVGGALGGFLAEFNYNALFWVDGITNIVAAVMMLLLFAPVKKQRATTHEQKLPVRSPYSDGQYMFFILIVVLFAVCFLQVFGMQTLFFEQEWRISKTNIGILIAANGLLIAFVEMVMVYHLEKKRSGLYYIRVGALFTGLGYAMVNVIPAGFIPAFAAVVIITIGEMLVLPFMNSYWISRTTEANRGGYAGLYTMAWSAAHVIAPTFGSQFAEHIGFDILWWTVGGICVFIAAGTWRLERKTQIENLAARVSP